MSPAISVLSFKAYNPLTRRFKRVNSPLEVWNASKENSDEEQFSEWSGIADDEFNSSWPSLSSREPSLTPDTWPMKSITPQSPSIQSTDDDLDENENEFISL